MALHLPLSEVLAMPPWEWDAWRVYWRVRPRFDPWWAMAQVCAVVVNAFGAKKPAKVADFYPEVAIRKRGPKAAPRSNAINTAADFDRLLGVAPCRKGPG